MCSMWLHICATVTGIYRNKDNFGLKLMQLTDIFKSVQVGKKHFANSAIRRPRLLKTVLKRKSIAIKLGNVPKLQHLDTLRLNFSTA